MHVADMIRDKRSGKISAEKFWYNVKSAASVFCLVWYIVSPAAAGTVPPDPLIIGLFLLLNEASAVSFIGLAARRYGINFMGSGGPDQGIGSGDELRNTDTVGAAGGDSGDDSVGNASDRCRHCRRQGEQTAP